MLVNLEYPSNLFPPPVETTPLLARTGHIGNVTYKRPPMLQMICPTGLGSARGSRVVPVCPPGTSSDSEYAPAVPTTTKAFQRAHQKHTRAACPSRNPAAPVRDRHHLLDSDRDDDFRCPRTRRQRNRGNSVRPSRPTGRLEPWRH